jgi:hypothetical protein
MSGHMLMRGAAAIVLCAGLSGAAFAQANAVQPQPRDPNMPALQNTVPEKVEPNSTSSTGNLSDKLERSDGVITPPGAADSTIKTIRPAPNAGSMPVIPPPGSPGGNQSVQPK